MSSVEATSAVDRLEVTLTIAVEHKVAVTLQTTSDKSIDDLKVEAIKRYNAIDKRGYYALFRDRSDVSSFGEEFVIREIRTRVIS